MFKDEVVVITGGSSGLGKALALRFAKAGAHIALIARNRDKLARVEEELSSLCEPGRKIAAFSCDVSDYESMEKTFQAVTDRFGLPDILINNAGILREGSFEGFPLSTFQDIMQINYFGILNCAKVVIPLFREKGRGRIVNISSIGGKMGSFGYAAYCSSKFAVSGLTEVMRIELTPLNIKVHLVCPGEFDSPMVDELNTYRSEENRAVTQTIPVLPLDAVADEVMRGIRKDRYLIIPGIMTRLLEMSNRWFPSISRRVVDFKLRSACRKPSA
jgi:3-dehydrosphinganine reductase